MAIFDAEKGKVRSKKLIGFFVQMRTVNQDKMNTLSINDGRFKTKRLINSEYRCLA